MKNKMKLWRRLLVFMASLLVIVIVVSDVANAKSAALNSFFGTRTFKVVKGETSEDEDTEYFKRDYTSVEELQEYMDETCRQIEEEGMVLLRNDNSALPLTKGDKVSLFGQGSVSLNYSSTGSSAGSDSAKYPTLKEALTDFEVNNDLWNFYLTSASSYRRQGSAGTTYKVNEAPWTLYEQSSVTSSFTQYNDAAIYVISRDGGEGADVSTIGSDGIDGSYLSITPQEQEVLQKITELKRSGIFAKVIVVLNMALPMELEFMFDESIEVDAALWIGNVGSTGIYALNDVLVGKVVPSGRLSDTYCKDNFSSPAMATWATNKDKKFTQTYTNAADYPQYGNTQNVYAVYAEGIYVGYRYYETRYADKLMDAENVGEYDYDKDVAFPFGYGLSYTEFYYDSFKIEEKEDKFVATVNVLNAGEYDAKEVVQVYLQKPYTAYDKANKVEKSAVELVGFTKLEVESGDYVTAEIEIDKSLLKSYDAYGKGTYIIENGEYYFAVGTSAHDALNNILVADGYTVPGKDAKVANDLSDVYVLNDIQAADGVDDTTYAYSSVNEDVKIENQFDFADFNRYEGNGGQSVTYVSRNDWVGTFPTEAFSLYITEQMAEDIKSYKELVEDGSQMPKYEQENGLTLAMLRSSEENPVSYDDERWNSLLDQLSYGDQAYLITNAMHQTVELPSVSKPATKDENGPNGVHESLTNTALPSEGVWASSFNLELLYQIGDCLAEDALMAGYTGLYAPGVNLHRTPFGGRAHEYFSEDPLLMGYCSAAEVKGMQAKGVIAYVKHFAVNDQETNRNGVATWLNEQEMREIVLFPFEVSFNPNMGNAHATMTSFNRIGCIWTSASNALMENVLRNEWGFDGFAITDMASGNAQSFMTFVDGIVNGTDCYDGTGTRNSLDDYQDSAMFANKMREASHRILYVTVNYSAIMNGISSSDRIVSILTWWQIAIIVLLVVFAVATALCAFMYVRNYISRKKYSKL